MNRANSSGPRLAREGAADVKAAGDARHGGDALVARRRRNRVAASHAHADERDPPAVDVVAADQVTDRVRVVADQIRPGRSNSAARPRSHRTCASRASILGSPRRRSAPRVGERLLLDAARWPSHRDRRRPVAGALRAGRTVQMARQRQPVAVEANILPSRRVGDQHALGRRVESLRRRIGPPQQLQCRSQAHRGRSSGTLRNRGRWEPATRAWPHRARPRSPDPVWPLPGIAHTRPAAAVTIDPWSAPISSASSCARAALASHRNSPGSTSVFGAACPACGARNSPGWRT